jgi:hypothetical protein
MESKIFRGRLQVPMATGAFVSPIQMVHSATTTSNTSIHWYMHRQSGYMSEIVCGRFKFVE